MSQQIIDIGSGAGAGDGDDLRTAFDKVNQNFANIYSGNVAVQANTLVYSVAGKQGNVQLAWFDVTGVASNVDVSQLRASMAANSAADRAYTDNAVSSLGPLPNVTVTGGNLTGVVISNAQITAGNITVTNTATVNGALVVDGPASVTENLVVGQTLTVATLRFADNSSMTTVVNLTPINNAVSGANARVTAANVEIGNLRANIEAANASIVTVQNSITTLTSNAATQAVAIGSVTSNVSVLQSNVSSVWGNAVSQAIQINSLRANIEAANTAIAAGGATIAQVTAANVEIDKLRANVTAANASIVSLRAQTDANAGAQHNSIAGIRANVTAANAAIVTANTGLKSYTDSAISSLSASLTANAAVQGLAINRLNANVAAANAAIAAANITVANIQISELRANVDAANAAIAAVTVAWTANAATQAVQINLLTANAGAQTTALNILTSNASTQSTAISSLQANIAAANAAIAAISVPNLLGNVVVGNIQGYHGNFSAVSGTVQTAAQPNITTIGTLGNLVVTSNITAGRLTATVIAGTLTNGVQAGITGVGTLGSLTVSGNASTGNVSGTTGTFTNVVGTLLTAAQPNITTIGTLGALAVTGNIDSGNINTLNANIATNKLTANTVSGTLITPVQTNITRVGTLVNLAVTGNTTSGNVTTSGTVQAAGFSGLVLTASQPNITTVGNLTSLTVVGNLGVIGNIINSSNSAMVIGTVVSDFTLANTLVSSNISGTLFTASQPNITSLGTLTSITTSGNLVASNVIANTQVSAPTLQGNLVGTTATLSGNILSGNVWTLGRVYADGNIDGNVVNATVGVVTNEVIANIGSFTNLNGTVKTNAQPFINSLGTLTELFVDGPVSITGSQFVAQDFYVTGNLFVNGNTTTVSAGNVTTSDKDLTLANGAVNSTAARGSGILIGVGGAYGNLTIYDGVWTTPNAFAIAGNVSTGNVSGTKGSFTVVGGTLETAAQPNITTVGVLGSVTTTGAITGANIDVVGGTIRDLNATNANLNLVRSTHVFASGNVMGVVGEFTGLSGSLRTALQPNITQIGTLSNLTVTGNLTTGNVSGTTAAFTNLSGTLQTVSQPNITTVGNLGNLVVTGVATVGGLVIESGGAGSAFAVENITATANLTTSNLTVTGIANLVSFTGTILNNAQPYITSVGTLTSLDVTGNVDAGNVNATTGHFANVTATTLVRGENVSANANVTATNGVFTSVYGTLQTAGQTNITSVGTLISLGVTGNVSTGNVSGDTGTFANIRGAVLDASQTNITTIGTLSGLAVTGTTALANVTANGATFKDINATHANIGSNALIAGNVVSANIDAFKGNFTQVQGTLQTNSQPFVTEVGLLGNLEVAGTVLAPTVGNVSTLLRGFIVNSFQPNITELGALPSLTITNVINTANITAVSAVIRDLNATTANIGSEANIAGNVTAANVSTFKGTFTQVDGTLLTNAQPFITSIGTLPSLVVTGNIGADNLNANTSNITGNSVTANTQVTGTAQIANLTVTGNTALTNNVNALSSLNVTNQLVVLGANLNAFGANFQSSSASITNALSTDTLFVRSTIDSVDTTTGALQVAGGVAIFGNLNVTGLITAQGNLRSASSLEVLDSAFIGNAIYLNDIGGPITGTGIYSNVANVTLFPSTVTNIDIGGEATLVNVGAISALGITRIRNNLLVDGSFYIATVGNVGSGNVTVNNDLRVLNNANVINSFTTSTLTATNSTSASITANVITVGNLTAAANVTGLGSGALRVRGGMSVFGGITVGFGNVGYDAGKEIVYINSNVAQITTANIAQLSGALQVRGGASIGGNLYVAGEATIIGNVNFTAFLAASINNTPIGNATPSTGVFTTLGFGAGNVRPPSRPTLSFDFANSRKLDTILNFSRTGTATYYDVKGNLIIAPSQMPRFTYDPSTLRSRGILIEESRTNLYRESNSFANASVYTTVQASISSVAHATSSPDGSYNAFKLIEDGNTGLHAVYQQAPYVPSVSSGTTYTASAFVKRGERDQVALVFFAESNPAVFDLTNGTIDFQGPDYRSSMQTLANGWYRIQSTVSKNNTSGNVAIASAAGGSVYYTGNGTNGLYIYGLQVEEGGFATSYIPTTTIANTRGADNLTVSSIEFLRRYNQQENSVLVDATLDYDPSTLVNNNRRSTIVSFNDGTASNRIAVLAETRSATAERTANLIIVKAGTVESNANIILGNLTTVVNNNRLAAYYQSGTLATAANGVGTTTAVAGNVSSSINAMTIGSGPGTNFINGTIAKIQVWPALVTGSQLSTLTK
jgi:predicted  nucleic acid-binding Zn-ribbon protein